MSTSKHFDKICIAVVAVVLALTILFMNGISLGITPMGVSPKYENKLFDTSTVHSIAIVMDDWDSFIESCENEEYSPCTVVIDGEKVKNVGIRAKGNTSLSNVRSLGSQRYSFKLEFDQYESGKSFYGLDKLCLNNLIQDNTMMKDHLVYQMMHEFGVESPLSSYVYITVNGEDWGLYLAVEGIEDAFMERNYGSNTGDLYKPDSMSFGGGRGNGKDFKMDEFDFDSSDSQEDENTGDQNRPQIPQGNRNRPDMPEMNGNNADPSQMPDFGNGEPPQKPDFGNGEQPQMPDFENGEQPQMPDFENGEMPQMPPDGQMPDFGGGQGGPGGMGSDDVKLKYIDDDPDSYSNIFSSAKTDVTDSDKKRLVSSLKSLSEYTDLADILNMDEVLRYFVVHNFVCNGDSYTGTMIHNYYLHEKDGKLSMIPWDYNLAFGTFHGIQASSTVNASIDNPVDNGNVDDRPMVGWIFSDEAYTEAYHELFGKFIDQYFTNDTLAQRIAQTAALIRPYVEKDPSKFCTLDEFDSGIEAISSFVSLRAEAVARQLSGNTDPVDTSGLNLSDMGTMDSGMGGGSGGEPGGRMDNRGAPTMPNGENQEPPAKPENISDGNMQMPERPDGENMPMQMPGNAGDMQRPDFPPENGDFTPPGFSTTPSASAQWLWLGISFAVLLLGILIAILKKNKNTLN